MCGTSKVKAHKRKTRKGKIAVVGEHVRKAKSNSWSPSKSSLSKTKKRVSEFEALMANKGKKSSPPSFSREWKFYQP